MKASKQRQVNIRSNEVYDLAHELAAKHRRSLAEVMAMALRKYRSVDPIPSTKVTPEEAEENFRSIMEGVREANRLHPVKGFTSQDIDDCLYDENGLPK